MINLVLLIGVLPACNDADVAKLDHAVIVAAIYQWRRLLCFMLHSHSGGAENAGVKMTDQMTGHETAGHEITGHKRARYETG